jgi:SOS-response transcriptional repressor LexA
MKAAGLRIVRNSELEAFKSKKAKYDFMKKIFADAGYTESTLSIKACQRFKLKRENAKEIAELDVGNIIQSPEGAARSSRTRVTRQATAVTRSTAVVSSKPKKSGRVIRADDDDDEEEDDEDDGSDEEEPSKKDLFSNMRDLISSDEESEQDGKKPKKEAKSSLAGQSAKKVIESDEE